MHAPNKYKKFYLKASSTGPLIHLVMKFNTLKKPTTSVVDKQFIKQNPTSALWARRFGPMVSCLADDCIRRSQIFVGQGWVRKQGFATNIVLHISTAEGSLV